MPVDPQTDCVDTGERGIVIAAGRLGEQSSDTDPGTYRISLRQRIIGKMSICTSYCISFSRSDLS